MPLVQFRLGIEQIEMAWPALHEQRDRGPRRRLKMRLLGRKRVHFVRCLRFHASRRQRLLTGDQVRKRHGA